MFRLGNIRVSLNATQKRVFHKKQSSNSPSKKCRNVLVLEASLDREAPDTDGAAGQAVLPATTIVDESTATVKTTGVSQDGIDF